MRYRKEYELNDFAAVAYDAVMLMANAIKVANSTDGTKIRDALAKTKDFDGVTGMISFNETGDPVKQAVVQKITDGKARYFKAVHP